MPTDPDIGSNTRVHTNPLTSILHSQTPPTHAPPARQHTHSPSSHKPVVPLHTPHSQASRLHEARSIPPTLMS